ncbi:hypothetical protein CN918_27320 [Priestia megaterium]|nr:hypothetical protein CN918_27320 [Priestia megaterium]
MKKAVLVSTLLTASFIGYKLTKKRKMPTDFRYELIQKKMENSGYHLSKTNHKGVYILEKNNKASLLIYDNYQFTQESLFNLLNEYKDKLTPQLYILSDTPNSLYAKTKTHFFRWIATEYTASSPVFVHFSTLQKFKKMDEPSWETLQF